MYNETSIHPFWRDHKKKNECGKTIVLGSLSTWAMHRDQIKWMILVWKQCICEQWTEVSLYTNKIEIFSYKKLIECNYF